MRNRRSMSLVILVALVGLLVAAQSAFVSAKGRAHPRVRHDGGVPTALTGAANPIRGINGGGVPWVIDRGTGELSADGRLNVTCTGSFWRRRAPTRSPRSRPSSAASPATGRP